MESNPCFVVKKRGGNAAYFIEIDEIWRHLVYVEKVALKRMMKKWSEESL